jgi:hypothetical protein
MSTAVTVAIPTNIALPAYLQTPDIAAQIAAENAAAAGGIRVGGFPKVSIEGGKFHEVNGAETNTFMMAPAAQGQPALPMMCFEAVIIAANPALVKKYYAKKWQKGDDAAPDCQSTNGQTPDAGVASPQSNACATCPQNAWGSKISEATGKEVKACSDSKQMVVLPAWFQGWTEYKALGLSVTPAALGDWGKYVQALSGRSIPVGGVVTNITFDQTAAYPKLMFSFNRFLTPDEFARVQERAKGDDVKNIVSPAVFVPPPAQLAAPTIPTTAPTVTPVFVPATPASTPTAPIPVPTPAPATPAAPVTSPSIDAAAASFAAPHYPPPAVTPPAEEPPKRTRAKRTTTPAPAGDLSHIPAPIQAALAALPADSPARAALLAQYPAPVAADPFAGQPPHVKMAVDAVGGYDSVPGRSMFNTLTGQGVAPVATPAAAAPAPTPAPVVAAPAPAPVAAPAPAPVAATPAPAPNFGAAPAETTPTPAVIASGASLKDRLQKILQGGAPAGTTVQ